VLIHIQQFPAVFVPREMRFEELWVAGSKGLCGAVTFSVQLEELPTPQMQSASLIAMDYS
jgi:hypothetical protein